MKVSIIIPVYNVSRYIESCMDSVMQQSYPDIECILVDDCSPDDSVVRINQKIASYSGSITFKIIHHKQNKGLSGARNSGIVASTGDYLYFLDSDDEMTDHCLQLLADLVKEYPDVDLVQGSADAIEEHHINKKYQIKRNVPEYSDNHHWLKKNLLESEIFPLTAWNKLIKRSFLTNNDLFYHEGIIHEDEHWNFFAAKKVKSMAFCTVPTYRHFIRKGSIMTSGNHRKSITSWFFILNDFMNHLDLDMLRYQRKMILKESFGNLVRITNDATKYPVNDLLVRQRQILRPLFKSAFNRGQIFELILLTYFHLPIFLLKILCRKKVRGIYFRILKYLV